MKHITREHHKACVDCMEKCQNTIVYCQKIMTAIQKNKNVDLNQFYQEGYELLTACIVACQEVMKGNKEHSAQCKDDVCQEIMERNTHHCDATIKLCDQLKRYQVVSAAECHALASQCLDACDECYETCQEIIQHKP